MFVKLLEGSELRTAEKYRKYKKTHIIIGFGHPFPMLYNVCGCYLKIVSQISKALYYMKVFIVENEIYNCSSVKFQSFLKKRKQIFHECRMIDDL
jgi:hypothetical protein